MLYKERIFEKKGKRNRNLKKKNKKKKREEKIRLFWINFEEKVLLVIYVCSNI